MTYPMLGDPKKIFWILVTEPEVNAIHAARGFLAAACNPVNLHDDAPEEVRSTLTAFWSHYGATLETLSDELGSLDDGPQTEAPKKEMP